MCIAFLQDMKFVQKKLAYRFIQADMIGIQWR